MSDYHRLSIAEKQAVALERARESPVECPGCGTHTTPADLLSHIDTRCPGERPAPQRHSRWITMGEAVRLGVARETLSWWARKGHVRAVGERMDRKYLFRDVTTRLANLRIRRR